MLGRREEILHHAVFLLQVLVAVVVVVVVAAAVFGFGARRDAGVESPHLLPQGRRRGPESLSLLLQHLVLAFEAVVGFVELRNHVRVNTGAVQPLGDLSLEGIDLLLGGCEFFPAGSEDLLQGGLAGVGFVKFFREEGQRLLVPSFRHPLFVHDSVLVFALNLLQADRFGSQLLDDRLFAAQCRPARFHFLQTRVVLHLQLLVFLDGFLEFCRLFGLEIFQALPQTVLV
mmetsp:Transcript_5029/g.10561  ORF Transcript_5029/g.10561 Transcript_5029/m.10561 type:complete len:229 (-) Transcript_5029:1031-1717(-)